MTAKSIAVGLWSCVMHALVGEPVPTPDQVRGRLAPEHALGRDDHVDRLALKFKHALTVQFVRRRWRSNPNSGETDACSHFKDM
jgi:hypothetical protein